MKLRKLLPNLFFLLFIAQILSPYINGITVYLEVLIALVDPYYRKWLLRHNRKLPLILLLIGVPIIFLKIVISVKLICLTISITYLMYAYQAKLFYLHRFFTVSIIIAIAQFCLFYTFPGLSTILGPTNISEMIWGEYSTPTLTNFYAVFGSIIRVSGLSREAGFFASMLICVIILCYMEYKKYNIKISKLYFVMLCVAYVISFSKMSFLIIPAILCIKCRKIIDKIPKFATVISLLIFFIVIWYHSDFLAKEENVTFTHRFGAYGVMPDINDVVNLLFGSPELSSHDFDYLYAKKYINILEGYPSFAGMGGYIISNGLLLTGILLIILCNTGISSTGILLLFLLTMNVQMDTNQNFVVLAYFIAFKFFYKKNNH